MEIKKSDLEIDFTYQRERESQTTIENMVKGWSWIACGTLRVGLRPDGTMVVIDGQGRKLAADQRDDIDTLPCMVYEVSTVAEEANAFLRVQKYRKALRGYQTHKAARAGGNEVAIEVEKIVQSHGLTIQNNTGDGSFRAIATATALYRRNEARFRNIMAVAVKLCGGNPITKEILQGLFALDHHLVEVGCEDSGNGLFARHNLDTLYSLGLKAVSDSIKEARAFATYGGERVYAEGIIRVVNKGRRSRKLPGIAL